MKIKSSPNSYEAYLDKYGFSNITELEFASELGRYRNLGKDQKTIEFIAKFLLKYGLHNPHKQWTFENTQYANSYTKIEFTCKKHGVKSHLPYKMLNDRVSQGCGECGSNKSSSVLSKEEQSVKMMSNFSFDVVEKMYEKLPSKISIDRLRELISRYESIGKNDKTLRFIAIALIKNGEMNNISYEKSIYTNYTTGTIMTCSVHGDFEIIPQRHYDGSGCPACTIDSFKSKYEDIEKDPRYEYDDEWNLKHWKGVSSSLIKYKCKIHGTIEQKALKHFLSNHGCPFCSESHMENKFHQKLINLGFEYGKDFIREKEFPDLIGDFNTTLRYDFFFEDKKLLIELDDLLHFDPRYQSESDFERRKRYDKMKTEYAEQNGFKLLRIRYDEFDKWFDNLTSLAAFNSLI